MRGRESRFCERRWFTGRRAAFDELVNALGPIPVVDPSARGRANGCEARSDEEDVYGGYDEESRRSIAAVQPAEARRDYWNRPLAAEAEHERRLHAGSQSDAMT